MRKGKLSETVLKRSVLRQIPARDAAARMIRYGADCAFLPAKEDQVCVYASVSAVPGFAHSPDKLVTALVNNLAAAGAKPEALLLQILLPCDAEESVLRESMGRICVQAEACGMEVLGGHTEVTDAVSRPQFLMTGIGKKSRGDCPGQELLRAGQELVLTKWIALTGTAAIAQAYETELKTRYPSLLVDRAKEFDRLMSVADEARIALEYSACAMHDLSQGGVFGALWEMAERAGTGLDIDLKKIPLRQEAVEICEYFDVNPYCLYSAGSLLAAADSGERLVRALAAAGIPAAVIGQATDGKDRILRSGDEIRYLDRPPQDEWYRRFEA